MKKFCLHVGMDFVYCMLKCNIKYVYLDYSGKLTLLNESEFEFYNDKHLSFLPFPVSDCGVFHLLPGCFYYFPF